VPRYFTREQAQSLLGDLEKQIRQALFLKNEYEQAEQELRTGAERVMLMGGMVVDRKRLGELNTRRDSSAARLQETLEAIHATGCQVKDLEIGLLDFPTIYRGQEVLMCWKLGEPRIEFWHGTNEGFRARKPIDQDFLDHHHDSDEPE